MPAYVPNPYFAVAYCVGESLCIKGDNESNHFLDRLFRLVPRSPIPLHAVTPHPGTRSGTCGARWKGGKPRLSNEQGSIWHKTCKAQRDGHAKRRVDLQSNSIRSYLKKSTEAKQNRSPDSRPAVPRVPRFPPLLHPICGECGGKWNFGGRTFWCHDQAICSTGMAKSDGSSDGALC
jgi:hypothetical protein